MHTRPSGRWHVPDLCRSRRRGSSSRRPRGASAAVQRRRAGVCGRGTARWERATRLQRGGGRAASGANRCDALREAPASAKWILPRATRSSFIGYWAGFRDASHPTFAEDAKIPPLDLAERGGHSHLWYLRGAGGGCWPARVCLNEFTLRLHWWNGCSSFGGANTRRGHH